LCQAIGRLTGTAQSKLLRRLYTTDDVYNNYMIFIENQKEIIKAIKENGNKVDDSLISDIALWKMSRPVDRKTLKLEKDMVFWEDTEDMESDSGYTTDENEIDGVKLVSLHKWINGDTLVGKMIRYLYDNEETISFKDFKDEIGYKDCSKKFISNIENGCGKRARYGKLWDYKNDKIKLNNNIREYIDEM